jgi:hypothetical protein
VTDECESPILKPIQIDLPKVHRDKQYHFGHQVFNGNSFDRHLLSCCNTGLAKLSSVGSNWKNLIICSWCHKNLAENECSFKYITNSFHAFVKK